MYGKKDFIASALRYSGANRLLNAVGAWRGLLVLNYHRIGDPVGSMFDHYVFSARQEQFAEQLRLVTRCCDVIGLQDLDRALLDRRGQYALITFDDGYRDNYELALPVLKEARLPAVFFLTTGYLDEGLLAWWDEIAWMVRQSPRSGLPANEWTGEALPWDGARRAQGVSRLLQVYKQLDGQDTDRYLNDLAVLTGSGRCPHDTAQSLWMTWDMIREMRRMGMEFGGHTVRHPILSRLSPEEQWYEIDTSKRRIEAELGEPIEAFSYPVGAADCFDATTKTCLERAGYRWGFSFHGGFAVAGHTDPYDIPRYPVSPVVTPNRLAALLTLPQLFAQP